MLVIGIFLEYFGILFQKSCIGIWAEVNFSKINLDQELAILNGALIHFQKI